MAKKMISGFTLIEIPLIVVATLALAVAVIVAVNPAQIIKENRDIQRTKDVNNILTAVTKYSLDNGGIMPSGITSNEVQLGTSVTGCSIRIGSCSASVDKCLDLSTVLLKYIASIPFDPKIGSPTGTAYSIFVDKNKLVTVKACGAEGTTSISISR